MAQGQSNKQKNAEAKDNIAQETKASEKTMHNSDVSGAKENVSDLEVVGNGDAFQLLFKASSQKEGWMKSTKAMPIAGGGHGGCLVQVTTQQRNPDGSYSVAEALQYVPYATVVTDKEHGGRKLVIQKPGNLD